MQREKVEISLKSSNGQRLGCGAKKPKGRCSQERTGDHSHLQVFSTPDVAAEVGDASEGMEKTFQKMSSETSVLNGLSEWTVYSIQSWLYFILLTTQRTAFLLSPPLPLSSHSCSFSLPFLSIKRVCLSPFFFLFYLFLWLGHPKGHRWHPQLRRAADSQMKAFTVQRTSIRRNCCVRLHAVRFRK